ncbi:hypothetical protein O3M35_002616 [Rhynocoris fuscipes]|uniref:Uncharacterized protein n=1 Tax=Rhynocoris fuscipes TaxID=488301 RepID=A0AAW1CME9_9HEMI
MQNNEGIYKNITVDDEILENVILVKANIKTKIYSWQRSPITERQVLKLKETSKVNKSLKIEMKLEDVDRTEWSILDTRTVQLFKPIRRQTIREQSTQAEVSDAIVKRDVAIPLN